MHDKRGTDKGLKRSKQVYLSFDNLEIAFVTVITLDHVEENGDYFFSQGLERNQRYLEERSHYIRDKYPLVIT